MVIMFIFISTRNGKECKVLKDLDKDKRVKEVKMIYGDYDVMAKIETETLNELNSFLADNVKCNPDIYETNILISI